MAEKRSHSDRPLKSRCEVLQELDKGTPQIDLGENYSILKGTKSTWKKPRAKILAGHEKVFNSKRIKLEMCSNINKALMKWLLRSANIPVNGLLLKENTCDFEKELGVSDF